MSLLSQKKERGHGDLLQHLASRDTLTRERTSDRATTFKKLMWASGLSMNYEACAVWRVPPAEQAEDDNH